MNKHPAHAVRRAGTYRVLSECFRQPDEALLAMLDELDEPADALLADLPQAARQTDLEALKVDHARLFVGPFGLLASPYGSTYFEDDAFMGDSTMDAKHRYEEEGLKIVLQDAPDHIVAELEFMLFLILKELEEADSGRTQAASEFRRKQASFLAEHLGVWVLPFCQNVEEHAQTNFYKILGRVARLFVEADHRMTYGAMDQRAASEDGGRSAH
ncbi:MAG: TorD/DmsD family molecular chaperone [Planctomycetota bacterium]|jgi:TorA maturation chaperone TorD